MLPMVVPNGNPVVSPSVNWMGKVFDIAGNARKRSVTTVFVTGSRKTNFSELISREFISHLKKNSSETQFWSLIWSSRSNMKSNFGVFPVFCCSRNLVFCAFQVSERLSCIYYKFLNISLKKLLTFYPSSLTVTINACFPEKGPLSKHFRECLGPTDLSKLFT